MLICMSIFIYVYMVTPKEHMLAHLGVMWSDLYTLICPWSWLSCCVLHYHEAHLGYAFCTPWHGRCAEWHCDFSGSCTQLVSSPCARWALAGVQRRQGAPRALSESNLDELWRTWAMRMPCPSGFLPSPVRPTWPMLIFQKQVHSTISSTLGSMG